MTHAAVITGARIVLAECAVDTGANEITAAPHLLRALELRGALVSGDAMYTQTALAEQIVQAEGDYFLQVKRNQPTLQQEMSAVFLDAFDAQKYPEPIADRPGIAASVTLRPPWKQNSAYPLLLTLGGYCGRVSRRVPFSEVKKETTP